MTTTTTTTTTTHDKTSMTTATTTTTYNLQDKGRYKLYKQVPSSLPCQTFNFNFLGFLFYHSVNNFNFVPCSQRYYPETLTLLSRDK